MSAKVFVLGANGRIGSAICRLSVNSDMKFVPVARQVYSSWQSEAEAIAGLKLLGLTQQDILINSAGIINPQADLAMINRVNFLSAQRICLSAKKIGAKAVSLGTVLERLIQHSHQNPYIQSKTRLAEAADGNWLHLQLHTIYGGPAPAPFMFAGLMLDALKSNIRFSMTSGEQYREYHHVDDIAKIIMRLVLKLNSGCIDVTTGDDIKLRDLATGLFQYFDKLELLGIGDIASPAVESYEHVLDAQPLLKDVEFREVFPAMGLWLEQFIKAPNESGKDDAHNTGNS